MANTEEQAVHLLNAAKLESDGGSKVDKLKGVYELVVNKQPSLIDEFLPEVAELQVDPAAAVRKYLPEFVAGAAQARPTASVLLQCVRCMASLLNDEVPATAKQAVLTCNILFRTVLALVVGQGGDAQQAEELRELWEAAAGLRAAVASTAMQHKNDGVRLNAAKFMEQAVLLLTSDSVPAVPGVSAAPAAVQAGNQVVTKSALVKDAEGLLSQLVALLKLRLGEEVSGPVAIVVIKGAGVVAQQRPQFLGKVLPPLLALANGGKYKVDAAEGGLQSSIANALKGVLAGVLRCPDPRAVPWRKKVVDAMHAMGAGALADSLMKQAARGTKRGSSEEPEAAKRQRLPTPAEQQQQQPLPQQQLIGGGIPGQMPPMQQQQQQQLYHAGPMMVPQAQLAAPAGMLPPGAVPGAPPLAAAPAPVAEGPPLPPVTSMADLQRVHTVMQALVAKGDAGTLAAIVGGLQPAVLADVVLSMLTSLPPRHALPPDHLPWEPWLLQLVQLLEPQTDLAALPAPAQLFPQQQQPLLVQQPYQQQQFQPGFQAPGAQQLGQPPGLQPPIQPGVPLPGGAPALGTAAGAAAQPVALPPAVPTAAVATTEQRVGRQPTPPPQQQPQEQQQPQQQVQQQQQVQPPKAAPPKQPPRPAVVPVFTLAPLPLTPEQAAELRLAAVLRILSSRQVASPELQRSLVSKLVAGSGEDEKVADAVLAYLLEDFAGRGGFELCMQWLSALFAAECQPLRAAAGAAGDGPAGAAAGAAGLADLVSSGMDIDSFGMEGFLGIKSEEAKQQQQQQEQQEHGGNGRAEGGNSSSAPAPPGTGRYQVVLLALLEGLREALPPSDKTIIRVLLEAPALPMPAVRHFLRDMCGSGPEWAKLALLAAKDVIDQRAPSRQQALGFVLETAGDTVPEVRSMAVRLAANRLFPQTALTAAIERHARQQLDSMIVRKSRPASAASNAPPASPPQQPVAAVPAAAAVAAEDAGAAEAGPGNPTPGTPPGAKGDEAHRLTSDGSELGQQAQQGQQGQQQQQATTSNAAEGHPPGGEGAAVGGPDEATAAQLCGLYCALCTKKHSLLRHLFEVYGQTSDGGRAAIHRNAPGLAKTLGTSAAALLTVVQDPPEGSLNLVINMLYVLTESAPPPPLLVAAGQQLFERCHDARVLPPLLTGMDKPAAARLLPALLDLPAEPLKEAVRRLVTVVQPPAPAPPAGAVAPPRPTPPPQPPLFPPAELLVALHTLDQGDGPHARDPGLLRKMMAGVTVCINARELFGREALAAAISQLLTRTPLPALFMRTVIQSLNAAPQLRPFVCATLGQLVQRQLWNDPNQWKGWVMCAQQAAPDSFPALLQLPTAVLARALDSLPQPTKQQLAAHATSPKCTIAVPQATLELLQGLVAPAAGA